MTPKLEMGAWVDAAHAGTDFALVVLDRSLARAGLIDAALVLVFGWPGYRDALRVGRFSAGLTGAATSWPVSSWLAFPAVMPCLSAVYLTDRRPP